MNAEDFYGQVIEIFTRPPIERHAAMTTLHAQVMREYIAAIQNITEHDASQPVSVGSDNRTLAEVIAHIVEWERFGIMTAERLERTKPHRKRLRNGELLDTTTMGWCLWVIYLDHEAVEHAEELNLL